MNNKQKKKLLLHVCCAPCLAGVLSQISNDYDVSLVWFNPNIYPLEEYLKRLEEVIKYSKILNLPLIIEGDYSEDHHNFIKMTQENSNEPEGGKRCEKCMRYRLMNVGLYAHKNNFDAFATTLSVSPYKNSKTISKIGQHISKQLPVSFFDQDFENKEALKRSIEICKKHNIYRQKFCGCEYSS